MAHMIETMAYAGAKPWHGLGVEVASDLTPNEILQAAELDWKVSKEPVYQNWNGQFLQVPNRFHLTRSSDGKVLDIVGSVYKPVQNEDAMDFFTRFVNAGDMKMETAGSLAGGQRIWSLASINDGFELAGGDRVNGYLLLCSPHKQGESFSIKFTSVRVVCQNTLTAALNGHGAAWKMSHTREFDSDMKEAAAEALGLAKSRMDQFHQQAELLAAAPVREDKLIEYVAVLSGGKILQNAVVEAEAQSDGSLLDAAIATTVGADEAKQVRETDINRTGRLILESILESPGSDLKAARGTWWGALNGVTHAVDHQIGRSADSRLTNAWFGDRANLKNKALELAVQYATEAVA